MKKLLLSLTSLALFATPSPADEAAPKVETVAKTSVLLKTDLGDLTIELDAAKAPLTVKNFLGYVDAKFYDNTLIHRVIPTFMVQGGGFILKDGVATQKKTQAPVKNESDGGLKNLKGTIAMARMSDLDSATAQFFLNTVDNDGLNHGGPYGGYTVFGKITSGLDVLEKIAQVQTGMGELKSLHPKTGQYHGGSAPNVPTKPLKIISITRVK